jgi:hypothetical protein
LCVEHAWFLTGVTALFGSTVLILLHELSKIDSLTWSVKLGLATASSDGPDHLLVIEVAEALRSKATCTTKLWPINIRWAERHHVILNMIWVDATILLQLLEKFVIFGLLLDQNDFGVLVGDFTLEVVNLLFFVLRLFVQLINFAL